MAYDEGTVQRIREFMQQGEAPFEEQKMFGGMSFMIGGNVACGVIGDRMIVRVGKEGNDDALARRHASPFDFTGKPMAGWIYVDPAGFAEDEDLLAWIARGVKFANSLDPK